MTPLDLMEAFYVLQASPPASPVVGREEEGEGQAYQFLFLLLKKNIYIYISTPRGLGGGLRARASRGGHPPTEEGRHQLLPRHPGGAPRG